MATGSVISGATLGRGGPALAHHLADRKRENDQTYLGATRGIFAENLVTGVIELTRIVSHVRSKKPLYHVHVDPQWPWTKEQWNRYWMLFECEFGFEKQAFVEAIHVKHDREHCHRVYSRARHDGTVIPVSFDYARREKLSRIVEVEFNGHHIVGAHNLLVASFLKKEGRLDVLASVENAGLTTAPRPAPAVTPKQRAQAERTGIDPRALPAIALAIWQTEVSGDDLVAAFALEGFRLAEGKKVPVLIDAAGGVHSLTRYIGQASAAAGKRIKAAEVRSRLSNIDLPPLRPKGDYNVTTADNTSVDTAIDDWDDKGTPQSRPVANPAEDGEARGRARPQPDRFSDHPYAVQYRGDEIHNQGFGDAASRRANRATKNHHLAPGNRETKRKDTQSIGGSRRGTGRARAADYRIAGILGEPEFRTTLDRIMDLTVALDPGLALSLFTENARVEAMLAEVEFSQQITMIEALALSLVRLLAWLMERLFGASPEPVQGDVQVMAEETSFFSPSA